ncbi:fructose-1-phosphate kinase [Hydrogenispora ethanolica]|uniref:Tagatose-6-phosphate kinase n=1 Tax=Hydrogenispora ethanolica TaxID=1082276 RepID=A0A4R1RXZ2_HYDET|nr:1-phosphofructokinase family hexose kinase [Hydrogenispora ethanolica]TCL71635.1 fructose-1-phosphate kinase [Hydrogenispora ethanolica]
MITTLTLNPCIDRTITIKGFQYGGLNRVLHTRSDFSGKGINVSIAVHQLGEATECLGFNYVEDSAFVKESLEKLGIRYRFIDIEGSLRTNIKVFDEQSSTMTEFNEHGHYVGAEALERLKQLVLAGAGDAAIMVFNGSVPEGVPKTVYQSLIAAVKASGVKTVLDADGELLLEGLKARPYFVKPNLYEFETAFKVKVRSKQDIVRIAREIIADGVELVCVSLGKEGAVLVGGDEAWFAPATDIKVKGVQGAGDSLVAGICLAIRQELALDQMLRYGVAAANASLIREGTLLCTAADFQAMLPRVAVEKITL